MGRPLKNYRENLTLINDIGNYILPITTIFQKTNSKFNIVGYSCYLCNDTFKSKNTLTTHKTKCSRINTIYDYTKLEIIRNTHMPIQTVTVKGEKFYRWGDSGKLYRNRADAEKQAAAAYASGYKEPKKDMRSK